MQEEKTFTRRLNGSVFALLAGTGIVLLAVVWWMLWGVQASVLGVVVVLVSAALTLLLLGLRVRLTVRDDGVTMSMLGNPETIPASAITGVERGPVTGIMHGAGIRFGGEKGNDVSYLVGGDTVRINTARQSYLVSVGSVDDVIAAIEEITARH